MSERLAHDACKACTKMQQHMGISTGVPACDTGEGSTLLKDSQFRPKRSGPALPAHRLSRARTAAARLSFGRAPRFAASTTTPRPTRTDPALRVGVCTSGVRHARACELGEAKTSCAISSDAYAAVVAGSRFAAVVVATATLVEAASWSRQGAHCRNLHEVLTACGWRRGSGPRERGAGSALAW